MQFILQPWQSLLCILVGWMQREQQAVIEYLRTEFQVLREHVRRKRLVLTDDQRRRLTPLTPGTFLSPLFAASRPPTAVDRLSTLPSPFRSPLNSLLSPSCRPGYDRIVGAVKNLGFDVSDQTVGKTLREHGEAPAPDRGPRTTWKTFLLAHWDALAAINFTTVEVWTRSGLVTFHLLFAMELQTRRVHFAGCTASHHDA